MNIILIVFSVLLLKISFSNIFDSNSDMVLQRYYEKYGSENYGTIAYVLDKIRFSSLGILIAVLWGISYLKNKNFVLAKNLKYFTIIVLVITQLLPLGYTIYLKGFVY